MNEIIDADELQKKQSAPYLFHGMIIQEVPIPEPDQERSEIRSRGNLVRIDIYRRAKDGLSIWGNTHRSE